MDLSAPRPIVHLFVGLHKTGTTAIRLMLDVHRESFEQYGFHIPRSTWTAYINGAWNGGHNNIPWEICANHHTLPEYGTVADLVREIKGLPERQHLLLSEDLNVATPEQIDKLKQAFADFDVRVIVFVRNQVDWIQAIFAEEQKWVTATTFGEWYRAHIVGDERLHLHRLCRRWADAFGTLTVRPYERMRGRALDGLLECCRAPDGLRAALAGRSLPIMNVTPGEFPLALIRTASQFSAELGLNPAFFNASITPAALTAGRILQRFAKKEAVITPAVAEDLFPLMKRTNAALAEDFGVELGPEYLEPVLPAQETPAESSHFSLEDLAKVLVASVCGMGVRTANQARRLSTLVGAADNPDLAPALRNIVQRNYPWQPTGVVASLILDELVTAALAGDGTGLYLERNGTICTAYRRAGGSMSRIRELDRDQWSDLLLTIQLRAGLGPVLGPALRQGYVECAREGQTVFLWIRHALTSDGELAIIEDRDAARRQPAPTLADSPERRAA